MVWGRGSIYNIFDSPALAHCPILTPFIIFVQIFGFIFITITKFITITFSWKCLLWILYLCGHNTKKKTYLEAFFGYWLWYHWMETSIQLPHFYWDWQTRIQNKNWTFCLKTWWVKLKLKMQCPTLWKTKYLGLLFPSQLYANCATEDMANSAWKATSKYNLSNFVIPQKILQFYRVTQGGVLMLLTSAFEVRHSDHVNWHPSQLNFLGQQ